MGKRGGRGRQRGSREQLGIERALFISVPEINTYLNYAATPRILPWEMISCHVLYIWLCVAFDGSVCYVNDGITQCEVTVP